MEEAWGSLWVADVGLEHGGVELCSPGLTVQDRDKLRGRDRVQEGSGKSVGVWDDDVNDGGSGDHINLQLRKS